MYYVILNFQILISFHLEENDFENTKSMFNELFQ